VALDPAVARSSAEVRCRAVLWDLDGTLIDSSSLWRAAYRDLAAELGGRLPDSAWERMVGLSILDSLAVLHETLPPSVDASDRETLARRLVARAEALVGETGAGVTWRPGARRALDVVRAEGLPTALVTTTWRGLVERLAAAMGLSFDTTVCGDDVERGKPAPDPYLLAAARLGVDPRDAVAVEDSPTGVAAAEAAGACVLAVPSAVSIPAAVGRTRRDTLAGLTTAELHAVVARAP
jgi:HAD superfamily hydrolase (TIGR01509 family)